MSPPREQGWKTKTLACAAGSLFTCSMLDRRCRALLRRFPYSLMFVIEADETVTVIACFHGSRDPAHWQKRA